MAPENPEEASSRLAANSRRPHAELETPNPESAGEEADADPQDSTQPDSRQIVTEQTRQPGLDPSRGAEVDDGSARRLSAIIESAREVGAELDGLVSLLGSGEARTYRDFTRQIEVKVDLSGAIMAVRVAPSWRRSLGPERLAEALTAAIASALFDLSAELEAETFDRVGERPFAPDVMPAPRDVVDTTAIFEQVMGALDALGTLFAGGAARPLAKSHQMVESVRRRVVLDLDRGTVTGVRLDDSWLKTVDTSKLNDELNSAFAAAREGPVVADSVDGFNEVAVEIASLLGALMPTKEN
ncbi:hypothetical protein GCM10027589_25290 [Actinocorallia lasiicapitis]